MAGRSVTMALLVGALYYDVGRDQKSVASRTGACFFVLTNQAFSAQASLRVFLEERAVFEHERRRGAYRAWEYFVSKSCAALPVQLGGALVFVALSYWLSACAATRRGRGARAAAVALATLVAESHVLLVGAAVPNERAAAVLCPITLALQLLFGGFFLRLDALPAARSPLRHGSALHTASPRCSAPVPRADLHVRPRRGARVGRRDRGERPCPPDRAAGRAAAPVPDASTAQTHPWRLGLARDETWLAAADGGPAVGANLAALLYMPVALRALGLLRARARPRRERRHGRRRQGQGGGRGLSEGRESVPRKRPAAACICAATGTGRCRRCHDRQRPPPPCRARSRRCARHMRAPGLGERQAGGSMTS